MIFKKSFQKFNKSKQQDICLLPFDLNALNKTPRPVFFKKVMSYIIYEDENGKTHMTKPCGYPKEFLMPYSSVQFDVDIMFGTNQTLLNNDSNHPLT